MINSRTFYSYRDVTCSIIDKAKGSMPLALMVDSLSIKRYIDCI